MLCPERGAVALCAAKALAGKLAGDGRAASLIKILLAGKTRFETLEPASWEVKLDCGTKQLVMQIFRAVTRPVECGSPAAAFTDVGVDHISTAGALLPHSTALRAELPAFGKGHDAVGGAEGQSHDGHGGLAAAGGDQAAAVAQEKIF